MKPWMLALFLLGACQGGSGVIVDERSGEPEDEEDETPPNIEHEPIEGSQPLGEDVLISATVTDTNNILMVLVWYKQETNTTFEDAQLRPVDAAGTYEGDIPGEDVESGGMDYYIEAIDADQNSATMPPEGADDPYHFRITSSF